MRRPWPVRQPWPRLAWLCLAFLIVLLAAACAPAQDLERSLRPIVRDYLFNFAAWEYASLQREVGQLAVSVDGSSAGDIASVLDYFATVSRIKALEKGPGASSQQPARLAKLHKHRLALESKVERIIERQVRDALAEQGVFNPIRQYTGLRLSFPPMNFKLEQPPRLLVVSPRDRIESAAEVTLRADLTLGEIEDIEAQADALGVSSLVVELGGLGATYPTFVTNRASLRFTLDAVAEEWLHQYLAFRPLGFLYMLDLTGIAPSYEIATINETVASMVGEEIGQLVHEQYYRRLEGSTPEGERQASGFDFDREMRLIRRTVDGYLERGLVEQAEEFMERKRRYLATQGYRLRKLNQAYFAFHGAYADDPSSISPIGQDLRALREQSASLGSFLDAAAAITSRQSLTRSLGR